jgi:hypothetical protein
MIIVYVFVFIPILINVNNKDNKEWKCFSHNINFPEIFCIGNALDRQQNCQTHYFAYDLFKDEATIIAI